MKLVLLECPDGDARVGLLTERGIVGTGQRSMETVIDDFPKLRDHFEQLTHHGSVVRPEGVRWLPPLPRPGKIVCSTAAYGSAHETPLPLLMTLKSAESVIGPGGTIRLPRVDDSWSFVPEAELGLVIRGPAKNVRADQWWKAVFGYTCVVDVMARGDTMFGRDFWLAKADTLGPLGPCIVTADELTQPNAVRVRSWQNGQPRQDFSSAETAYSVGQQVEFATTVMTLYTGDVIACGTSLDGLEALHDGDTIDVEIERIGRLSLTVSTTTGGAA